MTRLKKYVRNHEIEMNVNLNGNSRASQRWVISRIHLVIMQECSFIFNKIVNMKFVFFFYKKTRYVLQFLQTICQRLRFIYHMHDSRRDASRRVCKLSFQLEKDALLLSYKLCSNLFPTMLCSRNPTLSWKRDSFHQLSCPNLPLVLRGFLRVGFPQSTTAAP